LLWQVSQCWWLQILGKILVKIKELQMMCFNRADLLAYQEELKWGINHAHGKLDMTRILEDHKIGPGADQAGSPLRWDIALNLFTVLHIADHNNVHRIPVLALSQPALCKKNALFSGRSRVRSGNRQPRLSPPHTWQSAGCYVFKVENYSPI
jgi:hypothetical protein